MTTEAEFRDMDRRARERGMEAYDTGLTLDANPYKGYATSERESWIEGWREAKALAEHDAFPSGDPDHDYD